MKSKFQKIEIFNEYLGFTKQTALVLRSLGGNDLIKPCEERNISTSELHKLTRNDFIQLGADENLAEQLLNRLTITSRNDYEIRPGTQNKFENIINMLENSTQQLNFIGTYIAYCRLRLQMQQNNFFIEPNKVLTATSVLYIAVMETVNEVNDMEKAIQELYTLVPKNTKSKSKRLIYLSALFAGLGLVVYSTLRIQRA
ncbi:synaptogyrin [Vespula squamosa]|uniref:Synaptogyrin n=1 Tax=Vespula squamosa TaxID=30214 RepID=A0ABD2B9T2_VESSQ